MSIQVCSHGYFRCVCAGVYTPGLHHNPGINPPIGQHEGCADPPLDTHDATRLELRQALQTIRFLRECKMSARILDLVEAHA